MSNVYVGLTKADGGGLISKLIDEKSGGDGYCHAFLFFRRYRCCYEAHFEFGVKFNARGVPSETLNDLFPLNLSEEDERDLLTACMALDGSKYDSKGVFHFVAPLVKQNKNSFFCSELVVTVLQQIGRLRDVADPASITPNGLKRLIDQGVLND